MKKFIARALYRLLLVCVQVHINVFNLHVWKLRRELYIVRFDCWTLRVRLGAAKAKRFALRLLSGQ